MKTNLIITITLILIMALLAFNDWFGFLYKFLKLKGDNGLDFLTLINIITIILMYFFLFKIPIPIIKGLLFAISIIIILSQWPKWLVYFIQIFVTHHENL